MLKKGFFWGAVGILTVSILTPQVYEIPISITLTPAILENLEQLLQIFYISVVFFDRYHPISRVDKKGP